jgi:2'-5' RNA ligase
MKRLFLALWPDETVRTQLALLSEQVVMQPVLAANLHMTLVFMGASNQTQAACVSEFAAKICAEPFEIKLDFLSGFPKPGIQWLGCQQEPSALLQLADQLQAALPVCGYPSETRGYVPHVTLSRKVKQSQFQAIETPIYWQVEDFVLVESCAEKAGVRYRVIEKWRLGNAGRCV